MMKLEYDAVCLYDYTPKYLLMHQQYSRLLGKQSASLGKDVVRLRRDWMGVARYRKRFGLCCPTAAGDLTQ
jgi:hypothetical protein